MSPRLHPRARLALLALGALALALAGASPACSNDNQAPPPPGTTGSGASTTTTNTTGGSTTTTTSTTTTAGTGGTGGGTADAGPDSGPPCVSDGGATGCFSCPPQTNAQFLNACTSSSDQCTHFDNTSRLPFWDGGPLPA